VAIGTYTGEALIFRLDPTGGIAFVTSIEMHDNAIKGIAATAGTLFSVCATGAAAFHRISDFSCLSRHEDGHDRIANGCVAIQPDRFASVSRDLKLRLWSEDEVTVIETPHRNSIKCVTASVDGRHVATGSYVGVVAIYDLEHEEWSSVTRPTASGISSLTPGDTPGTFIASSYDGQLYPIEVPVTSPVAA
jgi:WD40 repeat protein